MDNPLIKNRLGKNTHHNLCRSLAVVKVCEMEQAKRRATLASASNFGFSVS